MAEMTAATAVNGVMTTTVNRLRVELRKLRKASRAALTYLAAQAQQVEDAGDDLPDDLVAVLRGLSEALDG